MFEAELPQTWKYCYVPNPTAFRAIDLFRLPDAMTAFAHHGSSVLFSIGILSSAVPGSLFLKCHAVRVALYFWLVMAKEVRSTSRKKPHDPRPLSGLLVYILLRGYACLKDA